MLPDRVIVNRPVVGPASVAVGSVAVMITDGRTGLAASAIE